MKRKLHQKEKDNKVEFYKKNLLLISLCFVLLTLTSIGYSALNEELYISGDIALRAVKDIRVNSLSLTSTTNGGYEQYNSKYTTDTMTISTVLPSVGSSVTYEGTIKNNGTVPMEVDTLTQSLSGTGVEANIDNLEEGTVIESGETNTFTVTLTRTSDIARSGYEASLLIEIIFKENIPQVLYTDPILTGNDPNLLNNSLVPVVYDATANNGAGSWVVADVYTEWYNYSEQEWANAVILEDNVTKNVGDTVLVPTASSTATEVKAMYVWIPRYEYTMDTTLAYNLQSNKFNPIVMPMAPPGLPGGGSSEADMSSVIEIPIRFIPTTQMAPSTGYRIHPAFQWDTDNSGNISASENISGIWVGKFETSASTTDTCYSSASSANCASNLVTPKILPNVKALGYQNVYHEFLTAQKFGTYLNDSTNIDSHMMKNSEWGAVAYLSNSAYGKYGNSNYTGLNKEVYKNDSSSYYTGRSSGVPPADGSSASGTCNYDNITDRGSGTGSCGGGASTTGNIYGVYDMSGGSIEYVMAYYDWGSSVWGFTSDNATSSNYAGFIGKPEIKYYDSYTGTTLNNYIMLESSMACNGGICYGHALSETQGWYSDTFAFVSKSNPWLFRGSSYGDAVAGVFSVGRSNGAAGNDISFRSVVLATGTTESGSGGSTTPDTPTVDTIKVTVTNDAIYPWTNYDGLYVSGNTSKANSTSKLTFAFTLTDTANLSFDWSVSSESYAYRDYIYYSIYKDGSTNALNGTGESTHISGTGYGGPTSSSVSSFNPASDPLTYTTVTKELEAGTYQVIFTYKKDGSLDYGYDSGFVKNFNVSY